MNAWLMLGSIALNLFLFGVVLASLYWRGQLNIVLDLYESAAKRAADLKAENEQLRKGGGNAVEKVRDQHQVP